MTIIKIFIQVIFIFDIDIPESSNENPSCKYKSILYRQYRMSLILSSFSAKN